MVPAVGVLVDGRDVVGLLLSEVGRLLVVASAY
jgi:hypothetical protein